MIVNVPNWEDLRTISLQLYYMAWANAVEIVTEFDQVYIDDSVGSLEWQGYVEASQADLQTIYTLILQSQEIGIKALIARVSPFLLLKKHEAKPLAANGDQYDFSDFQTIDASELVRVHNIFCDTKLSKQFAEEFEILRRERNKIAHIGLFNKTLTPQHLMDLLLKQSQELYADRPWLRDRVTFASKHRWANYTDYDAWSAVGTALNELWRILPHFNEAQKKIIFGRDANEVCFVCPDCGPSLERMMMGTEPESSEIPTAFEAGGNSIECTACGKTHPLLTKKCSDAECDGYFSAVAEDGAEFCIACGREDEGATQ